MDSAGNVREASGVGQAIKQTESKQQECRRHSTKEKILQGSFGGPHAAFIESGKDVKRQAQQFEGDKNYQDVLRSHEEHHANRCGQDEQDKLANMFRKSRIRREQEGEDRQDEQCNLDQMRKRIRYEHSIEDVSLRRGQE